MLKREEKMIFIVTGKICRYNKSRNIYRREQAMSCLRKYGKQA